MKDYEIILFDLDGTIVDSSLGITNSVMYSLKKFGITVTSREELYPFIGPPLWNSFEKYYGFSKEKSLTAVEYYREYYKEKGVLENTVYDGVKELLKYLCEKGRIICLATSKPEIFAKKILSSLGLDKYFKYILGATLDGSRVEKADVIEYVMEKCGVSDAEKIVMIGDREYDVLGAKAFNIDSIGVLYGFGSREELEKAGATYIVKSAKEIEMIID